MGYYEEKKKELTELLNLIRKEKANFQNVAELEREDMDKNIRLLDELGIYGEQESEFRNLVEAKDRLNREMSEFERYKQEERRKINDELNKGKAKLEKYRQEIELRLEEKREELVNLAKIHVAEAKEAIVHLAKEKSQGFPWLADAYSEYLHLQDLKMAEYLEQKTYPAPTAAEQLREIAAKRRIAEKLYRVLKYQLEYYERLFPWLIDFKGEDVDDLIIQIMAEGKQREPDIEEPQDQVIVHTTEGERKTLSRQELFQCALDRWWQKPKTRWQVGRDYERYIGYLYESRGYGVYYQGIVEGLADLGRDLICVKDDIVEVVQCKYWSKEKQIHEKHVFQLYGTVVAYKIDHPGKAVSACFATSTKLSDRAKQFAEELGMKTVEDYPLKHYPCIKCNVSRRDGTKIYHLPFDQQYDRTLVEEERNECYVETVKEAEALGFRRAFRWKGETSE
jgi:DUF2075 family protein